jgi:hypothetical protein
MCRPANVRFVENIRPFWVVLLLLALSRHHVHEVLAYRLAAVVEAPRGHNGKYPSSLECSEFKLSFQPFSVVAELPAAGIDESCCL